MASSTRWRWKAGTQVQTLLFDPERFTRSQARSWAARHGFRASKTDSDGRTIRIRQKAPEGFKKGTFRTIPLTDGVMAVVAVPKNPPKSNPSSVPKRRRKKRARTRAPDPLGRLLRRLRR